MIDLLYGCVLSLFSLAVWISLFHLMLNGLLFFPSFRALDAAAKYSVSASLVSAIHGLVTSGVGLTVVYHCRLDVIRDTHPLAHWHVWVSLAYLLYDLWAMHRVFLVQEPAPQKASVVMCWKKNSMMTAHHIIGALLFGPILVYRRGVGDFFVGCFYCLELSALFTNFRSIISKCGWKNTRLYIANGILMVLTFLVCRILVFPFMYFCYGAQYGERPVGSSVLGTIAAAARKVPYHCTLGSALVLVPQVYWLSLMLKTCLKMILQSPSTKKG